MAELKRLDRMGYDKLKAELGEDDVYQPICSRCGERLCGPSGLCSECSHEFDMQMEKDD